jgi:superfamily I DNA/RNA helicase
MTPEPDEQLDILQLFVRSINSASFADEVRPLVKELAAEKRVSILDAYIYTEQALLDKFEAAYPSPETGKRDVLGRPILGPNIKKQNLQKAITLTRMVHLHMQASLDAVGLDATLPRFDAPVFKGGRVQPEQRGSQPTGKPLPPGLQLPRTLLAKMAAYLYCDALKVDTQRASEAQGLLMDLDSHADQVAAAEDEMTIDTVAAIVNDCVNKLSSTTEGNSVTLSTIHQFKGSERHTVLCLDMGEKLDNVWIKKEKLQAYDGLHVASCHRQPGCSCPEFAKKKRQLEFDAGVERQHLAHVALSRPKERLVVSFVEARGKVGAALAA